MGGLLSELFERTDRPMLVVRDQISIAQRHADLFMPQQGLHGRQVYPTHHKLTGKRMLQVVKHQLLNPRLAHRALKGGPIGPLGCTVPVAEHRAYRGGYVHSNQTQGCGQHRIHGDTATRAILGIRSSHRDKAPREVYLFPGRGEQFTDPKSGMQHRDFCLSGFNRGGYP